MVITEENRFFIGIKLFHKYRSFSHHLPLHQLGKLSAFRHQLIKGSVLGNPPVVQKNNAVALLNGGQAVGDYDAGAAQPVQ